MRKIDVISIFVVGVMLGATAGTIFAAQFRYTIGYEVGAEDARGQQDALFEKEFRENCRPWFTDVKRQTEYDVWICAKPEFVK